MRNSVALKILAGYAAVAICLVAVALGAFLGLRRLATDGGTEVASRLEVLQTVQQMQADLDVLEVVGQQTAQGSAGSDSEVFQFRREEFDRALEKLTRLAPGVAEVRQVNDEYRRFIDLVADAQRLQQTAPGRPERSQGAARLSLQGRRLASELDALAGQVRTALETRAAETVRSSRQALVVILSLCAAGLVLGLAPPLFVALSLNGSIRKLRQAVQMFAEGAYDHDPQVRTGDELGELARGLQAMAQKFKSNEQLCLDASPLTRLPGNIAIERALLERLRRGEKFALCYADLDDFKAFNDTYGYVKGSELIKATGEILHEAKRRYGRPEDFVGHIGGDDFVLITSPELAPTVCENILHEFDLIIPFFYAPEDRERGFIETADRYGIVRQFPLMTMSIAVVSDASRDIISPTEVAQVAAEIKEFVKTLPGSNYLVDRRRGTRTGQPRPEPG